MWICVSVCRACGYPEGPGEDVRSLWIAVAGSYSCLMWALETNPEFSGRASAMCNCWAFFLGPSFWDQTQDLTYVRQVLITELHHDCPFFFLWRENTHNLKFTVFIILSCNSVALTTHIVLCNPHYHLVPKPSHYHVNQKLCHQAVTAHPLPLYPSTF